MGRPLVMLRRYAGISSSDWGVPWASNKTAWRWGAVSGTGMFSRAVLAHVLDDSLNVSDWGTGNDAVAKIKDVAGAASCLLEDLADALAKQVFVGEEGYGVEVALHGYCMAESGPALIQGDTPIETDDVGAGFAHGWQQGRGGYAE